MVHGGVAIDIEAIASKAAADNGLLIILRAFITTLLDYLAVNLS